MGGAVPQKRAPPAGADRLSARARRKKFRHVGVHTVRRADLVQAQRGVLVSCTPGHEQHAFRDAVLLLSRFVRAERDGEQTARAEGAAQQRGLERELAAIRQGDDCVFTRVVADVKGAVFLRVSDQRVDVEQLVKQALLEARHSGNAGSRHCIRVIPVRATCYAKAETAAETALSVVKERFPPVQDKLPVSYAIVFRARLNNSAKREQFIDAIAKAIHEHEPRYSVNLTKPDVVLIVEVLKTSCCIGTFREFYQLAKLNLREAACPSKPKDTEGQPKDAGAQPKDEEEQPKRAEEQTKDAEAQAKDAAAQPKDAEAQPKDAEAQPKDAEAQPKDAEAQPKDAEAQPKDAEEQPKDPEEQPKDPEEQSKHAEEQPKHGAKSKVDGVDGEQRAAPAASSERNAQQQREQQAERK